MGGEKYEKDKSVAEVDRLNTSRDSMYKQRGSIALASEIQEEGYDSEAEL